MAQHLVECGEHTYMEQEKMIAGTFSPRSGHQAGHSNTDFVSVSLMQASQSDVEAPWASRMGDVAQ